MNPAHLNFTSSFPQAPSEKRDWEETLKKSGVFFDKTKTSSDKQWAFELAYTLCPFGVSILTKHPDNQSVKSILAQAYEGVFLLEAREKKLFIHVHKGNEIQELELKLTLKPFINSLRWEVVGKEGFNELTFQELSHALGLYTPFNPDKLLESMSSKRALESSESLPDSLELMKKNLLNLDYYPTKHVTTDSWEFLVINSSHVYPKNHENYGFFPMVVCLKSPYDSYNLDEHLLKEQGQYYIRPHSEGGNKLTVAVRNNGRVEKIPVYFFTNKQFIDFSLENSLLDRSQITHLLHEIIHENFKFKLHPVKYLQTDEPKPQEKKLRPDEKV